MPPRFLFIAVFTFFAFIFEDEYSLARHFLLAKRAVFVENSKEDAEGKESIEKSEQEN